MHRRRIASVLEQVADARVRACNGVVHRDFGRARSIGGSGPALVLNFVYHARGRIRITLLSPRQALRQRRRS
jgi:hypothetical protein